MSLDVSSSGQNASSSSSLMFSRGDSRQGSKLSVASDANSWISDDQPIPWENNASSSSVRYPIASTSGRGHVQWRTHGHGSSHSVIDQPSRSINAMAMGHAFSRSRVSMDALPADDDLQNDNAGDRRISHYTISPSSSTASLPAMTDHPPAPPPFPGSIQAASVLGTRQMVGLGLPTFIGHTGRPDWPVVSDIADEAHLSDDELEIDVNEMEDYQASHRAPVDAALRSMPGVVGLGDGWAGGPQPKPKRGRWLKRAKREAPQTAVVDPLALWSTPVTPTAETSAGASPGIAATTPHAGQLASSSADPNAKWWRSRKNLFSSQRALSTQTKQPPPAPSSGIGSGIDSNGSKTRAGRTGRGLFGSMVDLTRTPKKEHASPATGAADSPSTPTQAHFPQAKAATPKRHSVATFLRKPPPHPLELTHGSNGSTAGAAARSQPVVYSASSSQPSLTGPYHQHPLLRQAYARSESHLAGGAQSPGVPPKPAPLIINSAPFVSTAQMPMWRQPRVSPTPLLEVEEEEEEPETTPECTERPTLKRSATFGDDEDLPSAPKAAAKQPQASQAPGLPTVEGSVSGSPLESHRVLSATPSMRSSLRQERSLPAPSLLGRIKNTLMGRGRSTRSDKAGSISSPRMPESPRSVQSEQAVASTPTRASALPPTRSVGRGMRTRSRLFGRRRDTAEPVPEFDLQLIEDRRKAAAEPVSPLEKHKSYKLSKRVAESMINLTPTQDTFGPTSGASISPDLGSRGRSSRSSWAAPIPVQLEPESESEDQAGGNRRGSRVTLTRFKSTSKRPALGSVFPRPPETMNQPPSLHWAFPGSYSTPMLNKFGGSTLSLALDISAEGCNNGLDDIQESPTRASANGSAHANPTVQRERALSATIAALTNSHGKRPSVNLNDNDFHMQPRQSVSVNVDNLANTSVDSLALNNSNIIDFPLPPSSSGCSGDLSSPDPDQMEHLCTPRDARQWPSPPAELHRARLDESDMPIIVDESISEDLAMSSGRQHHLRKQPSWSTCKTNGTQQLTPLATPTSLKSGHQLGGPAETMGTRDDSYSSLNYAEDRTSYMEKRAPLSASIMAKDTPSQRPIVV